MATVNPKAKSSRIEDTVLNKQNRSKLNVLNIRNSDYHRNSKQTLNLSNNNHRLKNFLILHQNICGILHKTDEFLIALPETLPQVLCLSEHHLRLDEINKINFSPYILGAQYCR